MAEIVTSMAQQVGRAVRAERLRRGWSQEALAARMRKLGASSWHQTTVAKVESLSKPRPVTLQEAVALSLALGLPKVDRLLGGDDAISDVILKNYLVREHQAQGKVRAEMRALLQNDPAALQKFDASMAEIDEWYQSASAGLEADAVPEDSLDGGEGWS